MTAKSATNGRSAAGPGREGLPRRYSPADHEPRIWHRWEASGVFHAQPGPVLRGEREPYCVLIPPPNVTARLHLGHALNNTLQDILIRAHRMQGYETLWMPGTDHAGIATQTVVEKRVLEEEGKRRTDFERGEFVAKVQAFKDDYEAQITDQLKRLGCSCDWQRQRFTMDEVCARAVREAFFRLFRDGLIYRGKRLVNWDPVTQTALADDEVEMQEVEGHFYYLRYPLVHPAEAGDHDPVTWGELAARGFPGAERWRDDQQAWVTVATTRPETYLGDTAVAVNPRDPRAAAVRGLLVELPLVGRKIPIIEDEYVVLPDAASSDPKAKYATGFLKVTPAHDPNDYEIGERHREAMASACSAGTHLINVMAPDASISDAHGWEDVGDAHIFVGKSREEARELVVREFRAHSLGSENLLEDVRDYAHGVGHSYRSHVPIEPYLSDQWYVKVSDDRLVGAAQRALAAHQRSGPAPGGAGVSPAKGIGSALEIRHRRLPHWEKGGSVYFVTFRVAQGELSDPEREIVLDACRHWHGERARVHLITVMPDHVHLLLAPLEKSAGVWHGLSEILHSIKSFTAHEIRRRRGESGSVWQDEFFDRIVRDGEEYWEKWNYMLKNPVKAGLVEKPGEYAFTVSPERDGGRDARPTDTGGAGVTPPPPVGRASRPPSSAPAPQDTGGNGALRFFPERYARTYEAWHENLRDWCISRQLWWGHRIPVWHRRMTIEKGDWAEADEFGAYGLDHLVRNEYESGSIRIHDEAGREVQPEEILQRDKSRDRTYDVFVCYDGTDPLDESRLEEAEFKQDPDVLDTWFSSALWPMSTMGWPGVESGGRDARPTGGVGDARPTGGVGDARPTGGEERPEYPDLLEAFNPTSVLSTGRDIITLWVSRMVMFNRYFLGEGTEGQRDRGTKEGERGTEPRRHEGTAGEDPPAGPLPQAAAGADGRVPFRHVYIHPLVQDGHGQRMSKSLGNGVDPLDIVTSHGADALRLTMARIATMTQDVRLPVDLVCPHCEHAFEPEWVVTPAGHKVAAPEQTCPKCSKRMVTVYGALSGKARPTPQTPMAGNTSTKFDEGRNFANKLWNAARFVLGMLGEGTKGEDPPPGPLPQAGGSELGIVDRWMLSRVAQAVEAVDAAIAEYRFADYADAMYDLMWRDFCDWYLEAIKPTVKESAEQRRVLRAVLESILRLLHPIMPHVTEVVYEELKRSDGGGRDARPTGTRPTGTRPTGTRPTGTRSTGTRPTGIEGLTFEGVRDPGLLATAGWPRADAALRDEAAEAEFAWAQELVRAIREVRAQQKVDPKRRVKLHVPRAVAERIAGLGGVVESQALLSAVETGEPAGPSSAVVFEGVEARLTELADAVDTDAERARLERQLADLEKRAGAMEKRLANPGYVEKAPERLVSQTRQELEQAKEEMQRVREQIGALG